MLGAVIASLMYEIIFRPDYEKLATGRDEVIQNLANAPEMAPRSWRANFTSFMPKISLGMSKVANGVPKQRQNPCNSISEGDKLAEP